MKKYSKSDTLQTAVQHALWDSFVQAYPVSVSSSSALTSSVFTRHLTHSKVQKEEFGRFCRAKPRRVISKSMEKAFRRYIAKPSARHAFVEAETATSVAFQIKALRKQRGWTQGDLAKRLATTQTAICRLEDPGYGRLTVKTLIDLANVFEAGLSVEFVSFTEMVCDNWHPSKHLKDVPAFSREAETLAFEVEVDQAIVLNLPTDNFPLPEGRSISFEPINVSRHLIIL